MSMHSNGGQSPETKAYVNALLARIANNIVRPVPNQPEDSNEPGTYRACRPIRTASTDTSNSRPIAATNANTIVPPSAHLTSDHQTISCGLSYICGEEQKIQSHEHAGGARTTEQDMAHFRFLLMFRSGSSHNGTFPTITSPKPRRRICRAFADSLIG